MGEGCGCERDFVTMNYNNAKKITDGNRSNNNNNNNNINYDSGCNNKENINNYDYFKIKR